VNSSAVGCMDKPPVVLRSGGNNGTVWDPDAADGPVLRTAGFGPPYPGWAGRTGLGWEPAKGMGCGLGRAQGPPGGREI
jgi:hypothetical protein